MAAFPSLSVDPNYPITVTRVDSAIRSPFDGGYEHRRPRYTRDRKRFILQYNALTTDDKDTLQTFLDSTRGTADSFTWTYPNIPNDDYANQDFTVYFDKLPEFRHFAYNRWRTTIELIEK